MDTLRAVLGKAAEIPEAIRKGKEDAIKNLITVPMDENNSIPYDIIGKFGSTEYFLRELKKVLELSPVVLHVVLQN